MPRIIIEDLESFFEYIAKTNAANTVIAYKKDLLAFLAFLDSKGFSTFESVDHFAIREYLTELSSYLSRASMNRKLSSIKSLFKYLKLRGTVSFDPTLKVVSGKQQKKLPMVLSRKEIDTILNYNFGTSKGALRDKALLEFLYSTGCRVNEVSELKINDVDLLSGSALVMGKGQHERIVALGSYSVRSLHEYLTKRNSENWALLTPFLFVTLKGEKISDRSIRRIVVKYANLTGINKQIGPHTIRHSFATHMLENGCNLRSVQEFLGHKRLQTTQLYTHLSKKVLKEAYVKFHPRSN